MLEAGHAPVRRYFFFCCPCFDGFIRAILDLKDAVIGRHHDELVHHLEVSMRRSSRVNGDCKVPLPEYGRGEPLALNALGEPLDAGPSTPGVNDDPKDAKP